MSGEQLPNWDDVVLVTVHEVQGHMLGDLIRAQLEVNGIPAILRYEAVGRVLGLTVDGLGMVQVQVPEEYADLAREMLADTEPLGDVEPEG
jgi:hypothetical protein